MASLKDKVVLVTGASEGIGKETAIHFASLGSRVSLNGRNLDNLKKVAERCEEVGLSKEKIMIAQGDVTKQDDVISFVDKTVDTFGQLDVLVNNAGVLAGNTFLDSAVEDYDKVMNTNVRGLIMVTQRAAPHLINSKGSVVNVSSMTGIRPLVAHVFYCMSKAAVDMLTGCLAQELGYKGVRVNAVNPGCIKTDFMVNGGISPDVMEKVMTMQKWLHPIGRYGEVDEVAKAIAFLASDDASFINGAILAIDGGRAHLTPTVATGPVL